MKIEVYNDIIFLKKIWRKKSCLLLLLCLIDSLAKINYPNINWNKKRYCEYLKNKFISEKWYYREIRIEEKWKVVWIDKIIYEYFRCSFIHELDDRTNKEYEIQIDYLESIDFFTPTTLCVDRVNLKIRVNIDWLIETLLDIVIKDI